MRGKGKVLAPKVVLLVGFYGNEQCTRECLLALFPKEYLYIAERQHMRGAWMIPTPVLATRLSSTLTSKVDSNVSDNSRCAYRSQRHSLTHSTTHAFTLSLTPPLTAVEADRRVPRDPGHMGATAQRQHAPPARVRRNPRRRGPLQSIRRRSKLW